MYDKNMSLNNIIVNFESVLSIEYNEDSVDSIISKSIDILENKYNVTFNKSIYELQAENQLVADTLDKLLSELRVCIEKLSFYILLKFYHKNLTISLADVNYLSVGKVDLIKSLRYLMDVDSQKINKGNILPTLQLALNNIPICPIKRLFIILLVLDILGVDEGVAVITYLLYLGGLQV